MAGLSLVFCCVLITALLLVLAERITAHSSFYRPLIEKEIASKRFHSIDGLRGFLALGVLFHHSVINYFYYVHGRWEIPPSRLATLLGQGGVAMFFMVTAFLFWNRALGGDSRFDARKFFWSRICRMVPMFWVSALLVIVTAIALTHFRLNVPPVELLKQVLAWLSFTALGAPDINGLPRTTMINTVFWSLVYEWKFYLFFPLLSLFARGWLAIALAVISALLIALFSSVNVEWYFLYGALAAVLGCHVKTLKRFAATRVASVVILLSFVCIELITSSAYTAYAAPMFFLPFLLIANGNTLFGLLTCRAARLLGAVSYSIYLLHNFVLYLISRLVNHFVALPTLNVIAYWFIVAGVGALTVVFSAMTFRYIEHPFLKMRLPTWLTQAPALTPALSK